jgi:hypothetical protein
MDDPQPFIIWLATVLGIVLAGPTLLCRSHRLRQTGQQVASKPLTMPRLSSRAVLLGLSAAVVVVALAARPAHGLYGVVFLVGAGVAGLAVVDRTFPGLPPLARLAGACLVGPILLTWLTLLIALALTPILGVHGLLVAALLAIGLTAAVLWLSGTRPRQSVASLRLTPVEVAVLAGAFVFAVWLHDTSLTYDARRDTVTVSDDGWADFALHVALARSFSWAANLPPEYPLYAGPRIQYHFGYDFLAGTLEALGLRLDLAFNAPAILSFTALLVLAFELGRLLCGRVAGGVLAALLTPLSTSWAWLDYVRGWDRDPPGFLSDFWRQGVRLHNGPYDGEIISGHFSLFPYVNQRQLTFGVALGLLVIYATYRALQGDGGLRRERAAALGALVGVSFLFNGLIAVAIGATVLTLMLLYRHVRPGIAFAVAAGAAALPVALALRGGNALAWHFGYLVEPLTFSSFVEYWWLNVGLLLPLVGIVLVLRWGIDRRFVLVCFVPYVLGNTIQFGLDVSGINHKLFNFWTVLMAVAAGAALGRLATWRPLGLRWVGPLALVIALPLLISSGLIDVMVIKNRAEKQLEVAGALEPAVQWVAEETPADAIFLTAPYFYEPPNVAGRGLYLGVPGFAEVTGYDWETRLAFTGAIYSAMDIETACAFLVRTPITYVQVGPDELHPAARAPANPDLWEQLPPTHTIDTSQGPVRYFRVADLCRASTAR